MSMTKNGLVSAVVLVAFIALWLFMLITSLHVAYIAIKKLRNNTVTPTGQGIGEIEGTEYQQQEENPSHGRRPYGLRKERGNVRYYFIK